MNIFHHTGDLGDIVAALPVIRELGGGELVISHTEYPAGKGPRESLRGKRFDALKPLIQATDYVSGISYQHPPVGVTHDIAKFRDNGWRVAETLTQWQARYFNLSLPPAPAPWLQVAAPQHGRIVIGRTPRYNTRFFPWKAIVEKYADEILFIGLPSEYGSFATLARGHKIEWVQTDDLYHAAKIIAGSRFYIGNQSVLFWIAAGLGVKLFQETYPQTYTRNSIVPRSNAFYSHNTNALAKVYDELGLDKNLMKKNPIPNTMVNLSTSAGDFRRNFSTSAEIYQRLVADA